VLLLVLVLELFTFFCFRITMSTEPARTLKVVVCGDVNGKFDSLFKRISSIQVCPSIETRCMLQYVFINAYTLCNSFNASRKVYCFCRQRWAPLIWCSALEISLVTICHNGLRIKQERRPFLSQCIFSVRSSIDHGLSQSCIFDQKHLFDLDSDSPCTKFQFFPILCLLRLWIQFRFRVHNLLKFAGFFADFISSRSLGLHLL